MLQRVYIARDLVEGNLIVSILGGKGLHPTPLRTLPQVSAAGIELSYGVEMPAEEVDSARQVLQKYGYGDGGA